MSHMSQLYMQSVQSFCREQWYALLGTTATYMYVSITLDHNEDNKIDFDIKKGWTLRMEKYMEQRTGSVQFHAIHPK